MNFCLITRDYPLVNIQKAIENCHLQLGYLLQMVIFHSCVSLLEGYSQTVESTVEMN